MNIAHVQGVFSPEHGGPAQSLTNYCRGQVAAGHQVEVWALEGFPHLSPAIRLPPPVEMHVCRVDFPARLGGSSAMRRQLRAAESPDLYHLHGEWLRAMYYGADEARRRRRPYVLEIMGMYEPWALRQKRLQKQLARWWYQDHILHNADCLHVNSNQEAECLRKLGFRSPVAVIPVGVDLGKIESQKSEIRNQKSEACLKFFPGLEGRPFILYLSRLHPKKGLDLLIRSWAKIRKSEIGNRKSEDWRLVISGAGEQTYVDECRQLAAELGVADQCLWAGHVDELQKSRLFTNAHCYVLPTSSENFGNTIAESLAHGTPVITTIHTPWTDLPKHRCGWLVDNTEDELCPALTEAIKMDNVTRGIMGDAGKKLVHDAYSLESVLKNIEAVYKWVTGGGPKPECVQTKS